MRDISSSPCEGRGELVGVYGRLHIFHGVYIFFLDFSLPTRGQNSLAWTAVSLCGVEDVYVSQQGGSVAPP
jgi:hypothetical protein